MKIYNSKLTKYHKFGGLYNRNLFSHSSGSWKPKIEVLAHWISADRSPYLHLATFSKCSHLAFTLVHSEPESSLMSFPISNPMG